MTKNLRAVKRARPTTLHVFATRWAGRCFALTIGYVDVKAQDGTGTQLRAAVYARLSETYDAAESVPTQLANAERHAARRG